MASISNSNNRSKCLSYFKSSDISLNSSINLCIQMLIHADTLRFTDTDIEVEAEIAAQRVGDGLTFSF